MYKALFNWPSRHLYLWFDTSLPSQVFISFGKPLRFSDSLIHCPCQSVLYLLKAEASGLTLTLFSSLPGVSGIQPFKLKALQIQGQGFSLCL